MSATEIEALRRRLELEIQQRRQLQAALRETESRLNAILSNTSALIYLKDTQGRYLLTNRRYETLLNLPGDKILGKTAHQLFPGPAADAFWRNDLKVLEAGVPMEFEEVAPHEDGDHVYLSVKFPIFDHEHVASAVCGIATDITERKRSEQRLAVQMATTRVLAESATLEEAAPRVVESICLNLGWNMGAVWTVDTKDAVLRCAGTWSRDSSAGTTFETCTRAITFTRGVGLPGQVWASRRSVWVADVSTETNFQRASVAARAGLRSALAFPIVLNDEVLGAVEFFTSEVLRPDDALLRIMDSIGQQIGQFVDQRRAERALAESQSLLQSVLDNTTAVIYAKQRDGSYILVNRQYENLFHVSRQDILGKSDYDIFSKEQATAFRENDRLVLASGRPMEFEEVAVQDDGPHTYLSIKFPLFDTSNRPYAVCGISSDITDRKRTEEALKHERYLLSELMENVPDAIYFKDTRSRFIRINRALAQANHLADPANAIGKTDFDYFTEEHARSAMEDEQEVMRTGQVLIGKEEKETWPDGTVNWVLTTKLPLRDQDGHIVGTFGISRDITQRRKAEEALRDSEALYHTLVEGLPLNVFRKDLEGRVTLANGRYCQSMGLTAQELIGKTDYDLFPRVLAEKYRRDDQYVTETGGQFETEEEHVTPRGDRRFVQVIKSPVYDSKGAIVGTQVIFWDVTERKRAQEMLQNSERRHRQFTEGSQDAIIVADQDGNVTLFNAAAQKTFGFTEEEVRGRPVTLLMPDDFKESHEQGMARFLATREPHVVGRTVELRGKRKNGEIFPLDLSLTAIELPEGVSFLAAIRDTTERFRMQHRVIQAEKMASLGLMSAGVAHEINNPLAFVANNLAVLDRDVKGLKELLGMFTAAQPLIQSHQPELANRIQHLAEDIDLAYLEHNIDRILESTRQGVQRVADIVQSLRGFARLDQAAIDRVDIHAAIRSSLEMLQGRLHRRNITVVENFGDLPRVACSPAQINQVFLNLLVNATQAIEATRKLAGKIEISTRTAGDNVVVEISDDGIGIPEDVLPKVFDPFFTTKKLGEGTGLGLSITHGIVEDHNGDIDVESKVGQGTRFRVVLPIHPKEKAI